MSYIIFSNYIRPMQYMYFTKKIINVIYIMSIFMVISGLYLGLCISNIDYQQGENYKIIYIHVPCAWMSVFSYLCLFMSSFIYLLYKHPLAYIISKSTSKCGALFTLITLITGSLWGFPMWGTFWVWDARLTSVLVLFFIYITHILMYQTLEDTTKGANASAIFAIIGFINIPIVKFSVDWWNTLHQSASIKQLSSNIHLSMLMPILIISFAFIILFLFFIILDSRTDILNKKISTIG